MVETERSRGERSVKSVDYLDDHSTERNSEMCPRRAFVCCIVRGMAKMISNEERRKLQEAMIQNRRRLGLTDSGEVKQTQRYLTEEEIRRELARTDALDAECKRLGEP